ncbi:MAG: TIM barrel protein [Actinomycetota bacterium]
MDLGGGDRVLEDEYVGRIDPAAPTDTSLPPSFSANLGFLWTDRSLCDAIRAAAAAGFDAVEFHQPFATPVAEVVETLAEVGLPVVSLNMGLGERDGDFGVAAVTGREAEARALIDDAIAYAARIGCRYVSVFAGRTGRTAEAEQIFRENLAYAGDRAGEAGLGIVIEPLSTGAGSDYHLLHVRDGAETVAAVGRPNVQVMADTFHVMTMDANIDPIAEYVDAVGHIQFSGWPDRREPDQGLPFRDLIPAWLRAGYDGCFGAEYTPRTTEDEGLAWLQEWQLRRREAEG